MHIVFPVQAGELELKKMGSLDTNVSRMITKLLVKDPEERWTSYKCMHSSFFKAMDDTTRMANSSLELGQTVRSMAGAPSVHSAVTPHNCFIFVYFHLITGIVDVHISNDRQTYSEVHRLRTAGIQLSA